MFNPVRLIFATVVILTAPLSLSGMLLLWLYERILAGLTAIASKTRILQPDTEYWTSEKTGIPGLPEAEQRWVVNTRLQSVSVVNLRTQEIEHYTCANAAILHEQNGETVVSLTLGYSLGHPNVNVPQLNAASHLRFPSPIGLSEQDGIIVFGSREAVRVRRSNPPSQTALGAVLTQRVQQSADRCFSCKFHHGRGGLRCAVYPIGDAEECGLREEV
jgi:hypothetical protein